MFGPGHRSRALRRAGLVAATSAVGLVLLALPAAAHVTVGADDATRGADDAVLTFRVPNEEGSAVTTKIDIKFPAKKPIASVRPAPKQGWTVSTTTVRFDPPITTDDGTITQGVGEVTYTATSTANGIPAGDFESFQILVGPLPDAADIAFPTIQTYSNGTTVSWIEPVTDPRNPPDNPAPVLTLSAAAHEAPSTAAAASTANTAGGAEVAGGTPAVSGYATSSDVTTAKALGVVGIVVGLLGLLVGCVAVARSRRARTTSQAEPELTRR